MDMKRVRDQARKENKANKKNAKGKTKAIKNTTVATGDTETTVHDVFAKKATWVKASIAQAAQTMKAEVKRDLKRRG